MVLQWVYVIGGCAISALYLVWICYGPAAGSDGSLRATLELAAKPYGVPVMIVAQLIIWSTMPRLFAMTPSPWIAAMVWPLLAALSKVVVLGLWLRHSPDLGDVISIVGTFVVLALACWAKRGGGEV